MTTPAFGGEVSEFYQRFRRGYPPEAADELAAAFTLTRDDVVLDLGCGTGQLTRVLAARAGAVLGMDPEPAMLEQARRATPLPNVTWLLGADTDVGALLPVFGNGRLAAVTVAQALHWMDHERLFSAVRPLLRPGGGIAVVTNGEPLWLQDTAWSAALRDVLSAYLGTPLHRTCGTAEASQERYAAALVAAGYAVDLRVVDYATTLTVEEMVGGVFSAMSPEQLPAPDARPAFTDRVRTAVAPHGPLREAVRVRILTGTR
ncbi:class I SAM-dependent methyltransferase [Amycolatopsis sp. SID8362]|uniref:class I SAM-dependent methyltransferase n=1 Tax=Amycolatopsis sp. SID8362 TaxID=2690346 RepID=UPI00136B62AE|nr:class I SAM-dependent methyltransferase [Amycolatopsis sp. SID8362]NBH12269.1 methyltransferase domain-containing protein [Amycolatopsis sp. SID8362]NED48961.1 class I SAM-dependent methyltransferase [Amycolatopsis sp. SID8362]